MTDKSSARINPSSAYDWGLAQPIADTVAQWETNFQITSCSAVSLSGMDFFLPPTLLPNSLVSFFWLVLVWVFFCKEGQWQSSCLRHTHCNYAKFQTYIFCEVVVQLPFNFGTAWFTCNLFSSCFPQQWDSISTRKYLEQFWTLIKYVYMRELQISWKFFVLVVFWICICRCSPWLPQAKARVAFLEDNLSQTFC